MMKIFLFIFTLAILVLGASFTLLNADPVQVNYYFGTADIALSVILVGTLIAGALIGISATMGKLLRLKLQVSKLRRS
ncbi:MAG: LapA family protein [Gammaproteobacteria bacterium]|nr:LapA family protein [Gammaproteobacteria bacterium]